LKNTVHVVYSVSSKESCVEGVVQRLKTYGDPDLKFEIKVNIIMIGVTDTVLLMRK
jgi:hypothetical protein